MENQYRNLLEVLDLDFTGETLSFITHLHKSALFLYILMHGFWFVCNKLVE